MSALAEAASAPPTPDPPPALAKRPLDEVGSSRSPKPAGGPTDDASADGPSLPVHGDDDDTEGPSSAKRARLDSPWSNDIAPPRAGSSSETGGGGEEACPPAGPSGIDKGKGRELADTLAAAVDEPTDQPLPHKAAEDEHEAAEQPAEQLERLVDELESELGCPICAAVLYKVRFDPSRPFPLSQSDSAGHAVEHTRALNFPSTCMQPSQPVTLQPGCGHAFCGACLHGYLSVRDDCARLPRLRPSSLPPSLTCALLRRQRPRARRHMSARLAGRRRHRQAIRASSLRWSTSSSRTSCGRLRAGLADGCSKD